MSTVECKSVRIKQHDGSIWKVDAKHIATKRADHYLYAKSSGGEEMGRSWEEEYYAGLRSSKLLRRFIFCQMTWEELQPFATMVRDPERKEYKLHNAKIKVE